LPGRFIVSVPLSVLPRPSVWLKFATIVSTALRCVLTWAIGAAACATSGAGASAATVSGAAKRASVGKRVMDNSPIQ
jgi:hypothetical protein